MKYLIVSDIRGAIDSVEFIVNTFKALHCDQILLLGDVLYHGPRNDLPNMYFPKKCIEKLNEISESILCVKGNCDAEVDQMVLKFKILDSFDGTLNDCTVHIEHGHHLEEYNEEADLVLYGHTHIPDNSDTVKYHKINPGSITIPKNGSKRGFAIWDHHTITLYSMDMEVVDTYSY